MISHDVIDTGSQQIDKGETDEIRSSSTAPTLPNSGLFGTNPDSDADYLIETDPAFANYKNWLSSDYILDRLQFDPSITQKRLGDGYYEQQYIRDQIMMLTGRYYLANYGDQDTQYKSLMDAGVTAAQTLNLRPGIALTASQVANLTTDIVWLVQQDVALPDGTTQSVLVPKVYTRQAAGQIDGTGNLIAANNIDMQLTDDLNNQGNIVGHKQVKINAGNLTNQNGGVIAGDYVQIGTVNDLNNLGGTLQADNAMQLDVGGDLNNQSTTYNTEAVKGASTSRRTGISQIASIYVGDGLKGKTDKDGNPLTTLVATVGGDTTFAAGQLNNQGGSSFINTQGDINLDAINTSYQSNSILDDNNYYNQGASADIGSQISSNNHLIIKGNNISGTAATINSINGGVGIIADGNVNFYEGRSKQNLSSAVKTTDKGTFSTTTTQDRFDSQSDNSIASNIEGNTVGIAAGNNIGLRGTNIASNFGTQLTAAGDIDILAAQNIASQSSSSQEKKSGLFGAQSGMGFTLGKQQTDESNSSTELTHTASQVGAIDGNVIIDAGGSYQQTGSNIIAGMGADSDKDTSNISNATDRGNTVIRAKDINIDNIMDVHTNQSEQKFKQTGLSVAISNSLVDSAKSINSLVDAGGNTDSTRMKGMAAAAGLMKAKALAKEANSAGYDLLDGNLKGIGNTRIQGTIGTQKSQSNSSSYNEVNQASTITTNNLALIATGGGTDSNININGSNLDVSNNALFQADNDFNVNGGAQTGQTRSTNSSSSAAIGGYASFGGQGPSGGITANASKGKGYANSNSVTYANSQIKVGGTSTLHIGNDVNIKGGVFDTNKAQGKIGGNVNIESLQDTATYDSNQKNMGFTLDVALEGAGSSLSLNGGKTDINADYKAVGQQSGIFTGDGGFDLEVEGKTSLIGGAITTTDKALQAGLNNYVSKGGITTQDIENSTSYEGDAISVGLSVGNTTGKPQANSNGLGYGTDSDSDSSITKAGITGIAGNSGITTDNQAEYAGALDNGFDATRVNEELGAQTEITQAFDQERRKIKTELNAKEKALRDEAEEQGQLGNTNARDKLIKQADKVQNQGLLFDAISGAIYGPNSNGATGYVAKAASPFVASQIGTYFKANEVVNSIDGGDRSEQGSAAHILAQGILGAAISYATGNDALTGGVSAGTGEATTPLISKFIYGSSDPTKLTPEQKDTISAITSVLGAGIGATTGSANDAANAAETSKVAVENNYYYADLKNIHKASKKEVERIYNIQKSSFEGKCRSAGGDCNDVIGKMLNFVENPYVKKNYVNLRAQTLAKLKSNPELIITYLDSENFKLNKADQSVLNTQLKPILQATGGGFGVAGSIGGTVYACAQTAGLGCYAAAIAGSTGATSSFDHIKTGFNNYGKPLSQQSSGELIKNLKSIGFTEEGARNIQLAADILGTGGLGYTVAAKNVSGNAGRYATSSTNVAQNTRPNFIYNDRLQFREELARKAGIPRDLEKSPANIWGSDISKIKESFEMERASLVVREPKAGKHSGRSHYYDIEGHNLYKEVEYHPGGGKHGDETYYKLVKHDGTQIRVIDPTKPFDTGTIAPNQVYMNPQGQVIIKKNYQWVVK